jgi:hypothetical protein
MSSINQETPTATESDPRELTQEEIEMVAGGGGCGTPIKPQSPVPDPFPF